MLFKNQNLEMLAHNYIGLEKDKRGFLYFKRFTTKQFESFSNNSLFRMMSKSTAGIYLAFKTNGDEIRFQCKRETIIKNIIPFIQEMGLRKIIQTAKNSLNLSNQYGGRMEMNDAFDIYINGERIASPKPTRGIIKVSFRNNARLDIFVKIFFPLYANVGVMNLTSNGIIEAVPQQKEKVLCLGDSITQGFDAGSPSLCYVAKIAEILNLDALNQGIGGYQYNPEILNSLETLSTPKFIIVAYGTNDWAFNTSMEPVKENVCNFYKKLNALFPNVPVFVLTPLWRADMNIPKESGEFMDVVHLIEKVASKYSNIVMVDGLKISPQDKSYYSDRRLHPNADGFAYIAEKLTHIIISALRN